MILDPFALTDGSGQGNLRVVVDAPTNAGGVSLAAQPLKLRPGWEQ